MMSEVSFWLGLAIGVLVGVAIGLWFGALFVGTDEDDRALLRAHDAAEANEVRRITDEATARSKALLAEARHRYEQVNLVRSAIDQPQPWRESVNARKLQ